MPVTISSKEQPVEKVPDSKKRGRGRPPLNPGQPRREPISFRTTRELRAKLDKASEETGRSLAQEVEYRLEQSFGGEQRVQEIRDIVRLDFVEHTFGGQRTFDVMRVLASELALLENATGKTLADPANHSEIRQLADNALKKLTSTT